jgi:hypothetical protein
MQPYRTVPERDAPLEAELQSARLQIAELKSELRKAQSAHRAQGSSLRFGFAVAMLTLGLMAGSAATLMLSQGGNSRDATLRRLASLTKEVERQQKDVEAMTCFYRCVTAPGTSPCAPSTTARCKSSCGYQLD